jgi:hypothetical protein
MANYSKNKKYHFTYRTTNLINGRYYLGMHSTNCLNDGYLGSGTRLYRELNKYGRDNFKLEILEYFETREGVIKAEKSLITEQDLNNENCLNLKLGGNGGFTLEQTRNGGKLSGAKHAHKMKNDPEYRNKITNTVGKCSRKRAKQQGKEFPLVKNKFDWKGRKHKPESIEKMKKVKKDHGIGDKNSQYGTCWITDGVKNRKIEKSNYIPQGWYLGRTLK